MNKIKDYFANYQGIAQSISHDVTDEETRLEFAQCRYIFLENLTIEEAADYQQKAEVTAAKGIDPALALQTEGTEIFFGFNTRAQHQLFAGEKTELYAINNANQITVRARPTKKATLKYTIFY